MRDEINGYGLEETSLVEDGVAERSFVFSEEFAGFDGHFPGYPVLPAVVQLKMAELVAEAIFDGKLRTAGVKNAKFLSPISCDEEVRVRCVEKTFGERRGCKATLKRDGEVVSQFMLAFEGVE